MEQIYNDDDDDGNDDDDDNDTFCRFYFVVRSIIRFLLILILFIHSVFDCPHTLYVFRCYCRLCSSSFLLGYIANSIFSTRTNRFPANEKIIPLR